MPPKPKKPWTEAQIEALRENFGKLTNNDLAERLGRPVVAIYSKARSLRLIEYKKPRRKKPKKAVIEAPVEPESLPEPPTLDPEIDRLDNVWNQLKDQPPEAIRRAVIYIAMRANISLAGISL